MTTSKDIHFGNFVRAKRSELGLTLKEFGEKVGVTEKRVWDIERMPVPKVNELTMYGIARAIGMKIEQLEQAWKTTPSRRPAKRKSGVSASKLRTIRIPAVAYAGLADDAKELGYPSVEAWLTAMGTTLRDHVRLEPNPAEGQPAAPSAPARHRGGSTVSL